MINPMENYEVAGSINSYYLENLKRGNRVAQLKFYESFAPKMLSLCMRYTNNREEAEDVLQEGFIKVFKFLHQFTGQGNFEGWMRRIFINTSIENIRKRIFFEQIGETNNNDVKVSGTSGYDSLAHADLLKIIESLSEGYRTIFNLYVVEGFSHREIANILNITESTSKSQLSRAKGILQRSLSRVGIAA